MLVYHINQECFGIFFACVLLERHLRLLLPRFTYMIIFFVLVHTVKYNNIVFKIPFTYTEFKMTKVTMYGKAYGIIYSDKK